MKKVSIKYLLAISEVNKNWRIQTRNMLLSQPYLLVIATGSLKI